MQTRALARRLGWLSLAFAAAELLAAGPLARRLGLPPKRLRGFGLRELGSGVALLSGRVPPELVALKRAAGDGMDLASLATLRPKGGRQWAAVGAAAALVAGALALDAFAVRRLAREPSA